MHVELSYDQEKITITLPDQATVFQTTYPTPDSDGTSIVESALRSPIRSAALESLLKNRRAGYVVIVVSDISRPVPYAKFLPVLLAKIQAAGVHPQEIIILIATGMHRPSTAAEREEILGDHIAATYRIEDHNAEADDLVELPKKSWAGKPITLNRRFVEAGFRIVTGLVEPHFMAGFSGGRKAVCPGLASLDTVQQFHGYEFLDDEHATNASLDNNPCHLEALSVAQAVNVDFSLNVVLNHDRQIVRAFAGELDAAHRVACDFVRQHANPLVEKEFDVVLTNSAGYPLDTTFYQCVKSLVSALPLVKPGGAIVTMGGCREGVGSNSYKNIMLKYSGNYEQFLQDIANTKVVKDQWQFQMHTRVLDKVGAENIHFFTDGLPQEILDQLSCNGVSTTDIQESVQGKIDEYVARGNSICVTPEGPYCSPVKMST